MRERPFEPDTDNTGEGIREVRNGGRIPGGMRFFYFMKLKINGEIKDNIRATTLHELFEELGISAARVAAEVNMRVVRKADYASFRINENDEIEIVNFVGGGSA